MNVPRQYLGVWQRTRLQTRDGGEDAASAVFWLQTDCLHGDIRVPAPGCHLTGLGGFAGITRVEADRCQWHRLLDSNPASGVDIGVMQFDGSERVIERATDDSYLEVWERLPASIGPQQSFWFNGPEQRHACLLLAGDYFFYAQAHRVGLAQAGAGSQFCFGRRQGLTRPWQISHSTAPERVGQVLLAQHLELGPAAFDELTLSVHRGWRSGPWPQLPVAQQEMHP